MRSKLLRDSSGAGSTVPVAAAALRADRSTLFAALLLLGCSGDVTGGSLPASPASGGAAPGVAGAGPVVTTGGTAGPGAGGAVAAGGAATNGGSVAAGGTTAVAGSPPVGTNPTPESAGVLPMLRLTRREYNNSVADLIGDTTNPASVFPDDGESNSGFEAPVSTSGLHVQYMIEVAEAAVDAALTDGRITIPCNNPMPAAETQCATQFVDELGLRVFRRPVEADERTGLLALFDEARGLEFDFSQSLGFMVKAMLQSPNFLYHWEIGATKPPADATGLVPLTAHQIAARLSHFLWEGPPDAALLTAAAGGQLGTPEGILTQAQRLLTDSAKTGRALTNFHVQWINVHNLEDLQKDTGVYPSYGPAMRDALAPALTSFVSSVILEGDGTLRTLLTAPYAYANSALAPAYGATVNGMGFQRVELDPTQRAGLLTQAAFLATNASPSASHPVLRGLTVWKDLLCGTVSPPPANVPEVEPPAAGVTTRQRYANHSANACAAGCHSVFDPLGFAFENYDAIGGFRTMENGQPVDATGVAVTPGGTSIPFNNAVELLRGLADNDEVRWCVTRQWFRYLLGRIEGASEQGSLEAVYRRALESDGYSVRDLLLTTAQSMAFRYRTPSAGETF